MEPLDEIRALSAELNGAPDDRLSGICCATYSYLLSKLRNGITISNCHDAFVYAAALFSLSVLRCLDEEGLSSFDAGTLKLSFQDNHDRFASLARQLILPWCSDAFAFCGVRG